MALRWCRIHGTYAPQGDGGRCPACRRAKRTWHGEHAPSGWAWSRLRAEALKRDGYRCCECGATDDLQVHHLEERDPIIVPLARLETLCATCHGRRRSAAQPPAPADRPPHQQHLRGSSVCDPLPDDELDAIRDCSRPRGWYPLPPCKGCGLPPMWVGGNSADAGYVQGHFPSCPILGRLQGTGR